jgi:hypothetical protein
VQHGSAYVMLSYGDPSSTESGPTPLTPRPPTRHFSRRGLVTRINGCA